jgi:hypothetical protein
VPIERDKIPWRELPHLRIDEAAELSGFSRRTITQALKDQALNSREVAGIRVIPTADFRRWIQDGEDSGSIVRPALLAIAENKADRLVRKMG